MKLLRIATRRSQLALVQSRWVRERLLELDPELEVELVEVVTRGDQIQHVPLPQVGGKGLFTREIEEVLLRAEADLAVHSLKDLPDEMPTGLVLAAVPERADARDALVLGQERHKRILEERAVREVEFHQQARGPMSALELAGLAERLVPDPFWFRDAVPAEGVLGTGSSRRVQQMRRWLPGLRAEDIRGNVDTRLRKLDAGDYDALILAAAGLKRLGLGTRISAIMPPHLMVPAPGQGALAVQARGDDLATLVLLGRLEHSDTRARVTAERAVLAPLGGGCTAPIGAYAVVDGDTITLHAIVLAPNSDRFVEVTVSGARGDAAGVGALAAHQLLNRGADEVLRGP